MLISSCAKPLGAAYEDITTNIISTWNTYCHVTGFFKHKQQNCTWQRLFSCLSRLDRNVPSLHINSKPWQICM